MGFLVFVNFFALRVNLSVAIVQMVNTTYVLKHEAALENVSIDEISWSPLSHEYALFVTEDDEDNRKNNKTVLTEQFDDDEENVSISALTLLASIF